MKPKCLRDVIGPFRHGIVALALVAGACAMPEEGPKSGRPQGAGAEGVSAGQPGSASTPDVNPDAAATLAPGVRQAGGRKPPRFNPEEFVGYKPDGLLPILGAPDFVRRDGPAQIWQYREKNCVFDVFLYREGDSARVNHVELRERGATNEPAEACFARMRTLRKPKPAG